MLLVLAIQVTPVSDTSRYKIDCSILPPSGQCDLSVSDSSASVHAGMALGGSVCASLLGQPPVTTATRMSTGAVVTDTFLINWRRPAPRFGTLPLV